MMQQLILLLTMLSHNILFLSFTCVEKKTVQAPPLSPVFHISAIMIPRVDKTFACLGEEQTHRRLLICSLHKGEYLIPQTVHSLLYIYHGVTAPSSRTFLLLKQNTWPSHLAVCSNINILTSQFIEIRLYLVRNIAFFSINHYSL